MTGTFHLLTGEYPPQQGGVGDYTATLAAALARRNCDVHVWAPAPSAADGRGVTVHAMPDRFGPRTRAALAHALPAAGGRAILQYVPNAIGARGANLAFCRWYARLRRRGVDARVMFHEPYFYFTLGRPLGNGLAVVHRMMAAALLRAAPVAYLATETWERYLRPYAPRGVAWQPLPIPATLPPCAAAETIARWRSVAGGAPLVGHFGTYGDDVAAVLGPAIAAILATSAAVHVLLAGRGSDRYAEAFQRANPRVRGRVHATGAVPPAEATAALKACDVLVQPYPDGVTTRRTSVMAGLAAGVATITTHGTLTERVWPETRAAALVPASDAAALCGATLALLGAGDRRQAQADTGRRIYIERFDVERAVDVLVRS